MKQSQQDKIYKALQLNLKTTKSGTRKFGRLKELINVKKNGATHDEHDRKVTFNPWPKELVDRLENLIEKHKG